MSPGLIVVGHCTIDDIHHTGGWRLPETMMGRNCYATLGAALVGGEVSLRGDRRGVSARQAALRSSRRRGAPSSTRATSGVEGRSVHATPGTADSNRRLGRGWDRLEGAYPVPPDLPIDAIQGGIVVLLPSIWQQGARRSARARLYRVALDTEIHYFTDDSLRRRCFPLSKEGRSSADIEHPQVSSIRSRNPCSTTLRSSSGFAAPWSPSSPAVEGASFSI
jgi:hypothetical protein